MSELSAEAINEIVHRRALGQSIRGIARSMYLSRRAVGRALTEQDSAREQGSPHPDLPRRHRQRGSMIDAYEEAIGGLIKRYPNITIIRLLEELRTLGYQGGYSVLRERVKTLRIPAPAPLIQRFEDRSRNPSQMDWAVYTIDFSAEGSRRVNLLAICWVTPGVSTCTSRSDRISRRSCASTFGPSSTWEAWRPPVCTTT